MPESISGEAKDFLTLMLQYNPDKRISAKVTSSLFSRVPSSEIWNIGTLLPYLPVLWIVIKFNGKPDPDSAFYLKADPEKAAKQMQIQADSDSGQSLKVIKS
jgi:serine/threonine protein kinase